MLHIFHNFYSFNTSTYQWAHQTALCQGEWPMSDANNDIHLNISKLWFDTLENRPDGQAKKAMRQAIVRIFNTNRSKNTDDWKFMKCLLLNMLCRKGNDVNMICTVSSFMPKFMFGMYHHNRRLSTSRTLCYSFVKDQALRTDAFC